MDLQLRVETDSEDEGGDEGVVDMEDIGQMMTQSKSHQTSRRGKKRSKVKVQVEEEEEEDLEEETAALDLQDTSREMVTPTIRQNLTKQGVGACWHIMYCTRIV